METAEPANSSNSFRPCKMSDDAAASEDSIKVSMGLADPAPSRSRAGNRFRCPYAPPLRTRIGMVPLSSVFAGFRAEQFARWATTVPVHPRFPGSAPISLCRRVHRTKPGAGCGTRRRSMLLRWREKSGYSTTAIPPPPLPPTILTIVSGYTHIPTLQVFIRLRPLGGGSGEHEEVARCLDVTSNTTITVPSKKEDRSVDRSNPIFARPKAFAGQSSGPAASNRTDWLRLWPAHAHAHAHAQTQLSDIRSLCLSGHSTLMASRVRTQLRTRCFR